MAKTSTNRRLTASELELANKLLTLIDKHLDKFANGDSGLRWALRRKISKELSYQERGKPMHRKKLKMQKREDQKGRCARCNKKLPVRGAVLDRFEAMNGYTDENTRLICLSCDQSIQEKRRFA